MSNRRLSGAVGDALEGCIVLLDKIEILAKATLAAVVATTIAGAIALFVGAIDRGDTRPWPLMSGRDYEALYRALVIPVEELLDPVPVRYLMRI
jgi:hypothetical protein